MTPPTHILEAAATIQNWMMQNGHRDWQLGRICDRSHAYKLGVCNEHYERLTAANAELRKLNDDLAATLRQTREKYGIGDRHVMREKNDQLREAFRVIHDLTHYTQTERPLFEIALEWLAKNQEFKT